MLQLQRVATTILAAGLGLEDALVAVVEGSEAVLECERVALYVIDWRANAMRLSVSTTPIEEGIKLRLGSGLVGACATEGRTLNVPDAYADERFDPTVDLCTAKKTQSALCVPIMGDDSRVCAVLCALNKLPSPPTPPREALPSADAPAAAFSGADEYLLSSVAVMAGHALSRMRSQYAARRAEAVTESAYEDTHLEHLPESYRYQR
jgi:GAF domain-containing protein